MCIDRLYLNPERHLNRLGHFGEISQKLLQPKVDKQVAKLTGCSVATCRDEINPQPYKYLRSALTEDFRTEKIVKI